MHIKYQKQRNISAFFCVFLLFAFCYLISDIKLVQVFAKTKVQKNQTATSIPTIYPRSSWSNSKYDSRTKKIWPAEYDNPEVIIVHHTATSYKGTTSKQIKKIYRYHSYTRRWGDIGYNYIIGKDGSIFEGRYGGNGVIGGHSYYNGTNYNKGSIGIAVLGNYVGETLSAESLDSLQKLVGWLAANNSIGISSEIKFHGKKLDSAVIGHKDVASTACPGKNIYNNLSSIRSNAASYSSAYQNYAYQISGEGGKYEISSGKRYSGSSKSNIVTIAKTQLEAYPLAGQAQNNGGGNSEDAAYPSGTLVKITSSGKQGIIENNTLREITSSAVLDSSYDASSFLEITEEKWASYASGAAAGFRSGAFVKDENGNYFLISAGQKRRLNLSGADLGLIDLSVAHNAISGEMSGYAESGAIASLADFPQGTVITCDNKNYFFVNGDGTKKQITPNVFRATFSRAMAVRVSKKLSQKYKTRGKLTFQNGAAVNYRNKYYFIENGLRRQFSTKNLAASMGYRNIPKAKRTEMAGIGDGARIE